LLDDILQDCLDDRNSSTVIAIHTQATRHDATSTTAYETSVSVALNQPLQQHAMEGRCSALQPV